MSFLKTVLSTAALGAAGALGYLYATSRREPREEGDELELEPDSDRVGVERGAIVICARCAADPRVKAALALVTPERPR